VSSTSKAATFVTVLGWLLVVFTAFGVLTSLLQNVMISYMFPVMDEQAPQPEQVPAEFLFAFRTFAAIWLGVAAFLLFAAWSFLQRRNWARRTFVVVFVLGAAYGVASCLFCLGIGAFNLVPGTPRPGSEFPPSAAGLFRAMAIMFAIMSAGFVVLFSWLVKRLRAPDVRAEFVVRSGN
jgi:hypothetical protein